MGTPNAPYSQIEVVASSSPLGAEIRGVDVGKTLDARTIEEIHRAWLEHQVVFFRDQMLEPDQQTAFAAAIGELDTYPFIAPLPGHPHVIPVIKERGARFNFGGGWHSDTPYQATPPKATLLYARDVPARGGDTLFASLYAAYEALSPGMQSLLEGVRGVFTADKVHGKSGYYKNADHPMEMHKEAERIEERYVHPIVRTHPETGRRALFVSAPHIERFKGMTTPESRPLLDYLAQHATKPEFTFRLDWKVGTLALWDNRCCLHYALNDYPDARREMHRVTLKGDSPA